MSIDTDIENTLGLAQAYGSFSDAAFFDALLATLRAKSIAPSNTVTTPAFTATDLVPPSAADQFVGAAMQQAVLNAARNFIAQFFPVEVDVASTGQEARDWVARAASFDAASLELPGSRKPGSYVSTVEGFFTGERDDHPDYVCAGLAEHLDSYVEDTTYAAVRIIKSNAAGDLYQFALTQGLRWQDRGSALQAVANYVATAAESEAAGAENEARIESAKSNMEQSMARWIEAQATTDYARKAEIARAGKAMTDEVRFAEAAYTDVEQRVRTAIAGAQEMLQIMSAARSSISAVSSASQVGF